MIESLKITKDKPITITVRRNGEEKTFTVQPVLSDKWYRIGIGSMQMKVKTLPFAEALKLSLHENRQNALLILELVKKWRSEKFPCAPSKGRSGSVRLRGKQRVAKAGLR